MNGNDANQEVEAIIELIKESGDFEQSAQLIWSHLKRTQDLHNFEDEIAKELTQSKMTGKLSQYSSTKPDEAIKKRKRSQVYKELESRLGNFVFLNRRINGIIESQWVMDQIKRSAQDAIEKKKMQKVDEPNQDE